MLCSNIKSRFTTTKKFIPESKSKQLSKTKKYSYLAAQVGGRKIVRFKQNQVN